MVLISSKNTLKPQGETLSDLFYIQTTVQVWQYSAKGFQVTATQCGEGRPFFAKTFDTLEAATEAANSIPRRTN